MDYTISLQKLKTLREWAKVRDNELNFTEAPKRSKMLSWFYSWQKLDYDSQKREIKSLHSLKKKNDVRIMIFTRYSSANSV